jgi:hypothetical protein
MPVENILASALILTEKAQPSGGREENALISDPKAKPASKPAKNARRSTPSTKPLKQAKPAPKKKSHDRNLIPTDAIFLPASLQFG